MNARNIGLVYPLRPSFDSNGAEPELEGWDNIEDADVLAEPQAPIIGAAVTDDEVADDGDSAVQVPVEMPEPAQPSKKEVHKHNLTHINCRIWCPHCIAGRRSNSQHRTQLSNTRSVPRLSDSHGLSSVPQSCCACYSL